MATTNWDLPTPADTDPACGQDQMRALAQAADAAMSTARGDPQSPWMQVGLASQTVAAGATVSVGFTAPIVQSSHNLYSLADSTIAVDEAGVYLVQIRMRLTMPSGARPNNRSQYRWTFDAPAGTERITAMVRCFGVTLQDIDGAGGLVVLRPDRPGAMRFINGANVATALDGGYLWLTRVGDEW